MYKPLTYRWMETLTHPMERGAIKDAGVRMEKVEFPKRLTDSFLVAVTSQFGHRRSKRKS